MPPKTLRKWLWFAAALVATGLTTLLLLTYCHARETRQADKARCFKQAENAATVIAKEMAGLEQVAHDLAAALERGQVDPTGIHAQVARALTQAPPAILRLGVLFRPLATGTPKPLFGPYAERNGAGIRRYRYEDDGDYSTQPWFRQEPWQAGWQEPEVAQRGGWLTVDYLQPFRLPGATAPSGMVRLHVLLQGVQAIVNQLDLGHGGFVYLLSAKGVYLAHPVQELVLSRASIRDSADTPESQRLADLVTRHQSGFLEGVSPITGQPVWVIQQFIPSLGWFIDLDYLRQDLHPVDNRERRMVALEITLALALALILICLACGAHRMGRKNLWATVIASSLAMVVANAFLFRYIYGLPPPQRDSEFQVLDKAARSRVEAQNATHLEGTARVPTTYIATGVFLETLEVTGPGLIRMTGQIWQHLPRQTPREQRGITFPEAISGEAPLGIEKEEGDSVIQFYPFRVVAREETDSVDPYPFDRTRVRLRIWPKEFYGPQFLVPDLETYLVASPSALPGVDDEIELPGWKVEASEFAYSKELYNTGFGLKDFQGQNRAPELLFNITLKRKFGSPFLAAFLPIIAVAGLLFTLVLTVSRLDNQVKATGYSYLNFLRTTIALFFSLVVAQFNIRNRIVADGVLCLEWYFFIMYAAILAVSINALAYARSDHPVLGYDDNAIAKLAFWPVLLGCFYINSLFFF